MQNVTLDDLPQASPHKCYGCGTGEASRGPYSDLGITLEFYGAVQLCKTCTNYMAGTLGYLSAVEVSNILTYVDVLENHVKELHEMETNLRGIIEQLSNSAPVDRIEFPEPSIRFDFSTLLSRQCEESIQFIREYEQRVAESELEESGELESEGDRVSEQIDDEGMAVIPDLKSTGQTKLFRLQWSSTCRNVG